MSNEPSSPSRPVPSRRASARALRHGASLVVSLLPGAAFALGLALLSGSRRFVWITSPAAWPWQLLVIACAGTAATVAGILDWLYHRREGVRVGPRERHAELLALCFGGVPLFALMAAASLSASPLDYLVPVLAVLVFTTVMVAYDEVAFHRHRCGRLEHVLHRTLTLGHLSAFLAWAHWAFVAQRGA